MNPVGPKQITVNLQRTVSGLQPSTSTARLSPAQAQTLEKTRKIVVSSTDLAKKIQEQPNEQPTILAEEIAMELALLRKQRKAVRQRLASMRIMTETMTSQLASALLSADSPTDQLSAVKDLYHK